MLRFRNYVDDITIKLDPVTGAAHVAGFVNVIDQSDPYTANPGERGLIPNVKAQVLGGAEIYNAQPTNDDRVSPAVQPSGITPLGGKTYEFVGGGIGWLITSFNGQAA